MIGAQGKLRDRPGFEVDFITRSLASGTMHAHDRPSALKPVKGHWRVTWAGAGKNAAGETVLAPGDTMSVPEALPHTAVPSMEGEAALYHLIATDDPAGLTRRD